MNRILPELIGVISCGGLSSRMGSDKSLLNYHGKPQRYFLYDLLKTFCNNAFISCNMEQSNSIRKGYEYIVDKEEYSNHGPISGLLSSFIENPQKSILFVGCDYPYLNSECIQKLISNRSNPLSAVCYLNPENNIIEPLITIYENNCYKELLKRFLENKYSLREFLETINIIPIISKNINILKSIDTKEEYEKLIKILN